MNETPTPPQMSREEFLRQSAELACEFIFLLRGRVLTTGVVMQAAMEVHRYAAAQMPLEDQCGVSKAMAVYASELQLGLSPLNFSQTTH